MFNYDPFLLGVFLSFEHFIHLEHQVIIDSCVSSFDNFISLPMMPAFSANSFGLFSKLISTFAKLLMVPFSKNFGTFLRLLSPMCRPTYNHNQDGWFTKTMHPVEEVFIKNEISIRAAFCENP